MVTGDEDHGGVWESFAEPLELPEGKDDCGIVWSDGMKEIARDDDRVRSSGNDAVNGGSEGLGNVGFPLIDAGRGLPVVLPDAEVGVCDVSQFHGWRMDLNARKSKNLSALTVGETRLPYPPYESSARLSAGIPRRGARTSPFTRRPRQAVKKA